MRSSAFATQPKKPGTEDFGKLLTPEATNAIRRGLEYLASRQNEDGSFGAGAYSRNVAVCGLCGMAFLSNGSSPGRGPFGRNINAVTEMILSRAEDSGFITYPGFVSRGPMYGHGFATMYLAEVYGMYRESAIRDKLARAVRLIIDSQNEEGGWRYEPRRADADISVTVCQVMALRAARNTGFFVPNETIDRAIEYITKSQNPNGGFVYQLAVGGESAFARTAAAVVAMHSAGIYDSDEVRRGLKFLMQFAPRPRSFGKERYYLYGHYYAAQAMWQARENWVDWYGGVRDAILPEQRPDGSWFESISPEYSTAMACLILQMPANYLPIFQR